MAPISNYWVFVGSGEGASSADDLNVRIDDLRHRTDSGFNRIDFAALR